MKRTLFYLCLLSVLLSFTTCIGTKEFVRTQNDLYSDDKPERLNLKVSIVHKDEKFSTLFYEIDSKALELKKRNPADSFGQTNIKLSYRLIRKFGGSPRNDTAFHFIRENIALNSTVLVKGSWKIRLQSGYDWMIELNATDLNGVARGYALIDANKENKFSALNYFVTDKDSNVIIAKTFYENQQVLIMNTQMPSTKKISVSFYKNQGIPAPPPFSDRAAIKLNLKVDSVFQLEHTGGRFVFRFLQCGNYFFRTDSSSTEGLSLYCREKKYPEITSAEEKINACVYLTKSDEFLKLSASANSVSVLDSFWLAMGGSKIRANNLMGEYFKRVKTANQYFSSYLDGWKTDRGMIWIIFGRPKMIIKSAGAENWTYGDNREKPELIFVFTKMKNPFSDNDYALDKNSIKPEQWYNAVDVWRQGRVYNAN